MRKETIEKAISHLPATRAELATALGVQGVQGNRIAKHLIEHRYAEEWGQKVNDKGVWAPVLIATEKVPV